MQYHSWDLGHVAAGAIVQVRLTGTAANVKLMDSSNFSAYKHGARHSFYGGHYDHAPIRIPIPSSGHWYVTIDYGGLRGSGRASVEVLG